MYTGEVKSESEMLEPGTQGIAVICAEAQRPMFDWRRYTFHTTQPKSCAYVRTKPAENVAYVFPDVQAFFHLAASTENVRSSGTMSSSPVRLLWPV